MTNTTGKKSRLMIATGTAALAAFLAPPPAYAQEAAQRFDIPAQALSSALLQLGRQAKISVAAPIDLTHGRTANAVSGEMPTREALTRLLDGSGLQFSFVGENAVRVSRSGDGLGESAENAAGTGNLVESADIIVTAQKYEQRLQDVPVPVTVLNTSQLTETGQTRLEDYYRTVPGLSFAPVSDGGRPTLIIRGITTGGLTNPTVGVVIDDVPYGGSITPGMTATAPDIDPGDLQRVEILRGPQGTLYGASSLGGLLKFVTVDPSTDKISGRVQAGLETVRYSNDPGYSFRASINVPLGEKVAVRASGFKLRDAGYIDNLFTGKDDANTRDSEGGRIAVLFRPSEDFSIKLNGMFQNSFRHAGEETDVLLGSSPTQSYLPGTMVYGRKTRAFSAILNGELGNVDLTSITAYSVDKIYTNLDYSADFGGLADFFFPNTGSTASDGPETQRFKKFTQEFRASIPIGDHATLLAGLFYADEKILDDFHVYAVNPTTLQRTGVMLDFVVPTSFKELAAFTNLTVELTDQLDVQFGGRLSKTKTVFSDHNGGPLSTLLFGSDPFDVPEFGSKDHAVTYLITPRYKVSSDLMIYGRLATGYRPGGPNLACGGTSGIPCQVDPDKTTNYELGVKGDLLGKALTMDLSIYYIGWKNIQLQFPSNNALFAYRDNASEARSQGIELALGSKPLAGMTLNGFVAYNDAELKEDIPGSTGIQGLRGDRLPYSSRYSGSFSADQEFPLGADLTASIGGTVSYVGKRPGGFKSPADPRVNFPGYTQIDLRASVSYDSWSVNAYINNLTNRRPFVRGGPDATVNQNVASYNRPRVIGLSLAKTF